MTQWIDEIEWNNLQAGEIVDLLGRHNANLSEVTQIIDKLSVAGTNSNTTIFYSGLVDTDAFVEGHKQAGTRIIDSTKAGDLLGDAEFKKYIYETFKGENIDSFLYDGKDGLWARTSKRFAEATAGEIRVELGPNLRRNSVFIQTELPVIIENVNIHTANGLPKENFLKGLFGGTDYTLDPVTAKRVEKILKDATHLYSSPTLQKILNRLGMVGIALGLTTVASMAKAAVEDDDMDGAIEIVSDFFVSEFSGAAGGALSVSAAIKVLTCLSVTNPVIFGGTLFLSGILGAIAASEIGGAIFNEHKDRIISAVRDLFGWESTYDGEQNLRQVLKRQNIMAETTRSPLILDLDGNGVETVSVNDGVYFDHDGNGFAEKSGWVSENDGILVRDLNNNGQIDDGNELFGDQTLLSDDTKAANGFEALADLDTNQDGVFDGDDEAFGEVKVWQDKNGNGVVDDGELKTLNEAGVVSVNLNYQNQSFTDDNGNEHGQTGTFMRTDGTSGTITDVWFDADYADTADLTDVVISDEIALLPEVEGFGNVHNLQTAMALDTTGELKGLVQQYVSTTNRSVRDGILIDLIYTWAGVIDVDPESRAARMLYGNAIGDARKLETLEEFLGEEYLGTWCWGERDPNPHGHATPILLNMFETLKDYIDGVLLSQTHMKSYFDSIVPQWSDETLQIEVDISATLDLLETGYEAAGTEGALFLNDFAKILEAHGDFGQDVIDAFRAAGDPSGEGSSFELALASLGADNVGTSLNDTIKGTDFDDQLFGFDGNDYISGGDGNDTLNGGSGNDTLLGGNGDDTYVFEQGFGHDKVSNFQSSSGNYSDTILFKEGLSPDNAVVYREGYDLIISFGENDSLRIFSYFDKRGLSQSAVDTIQFSDEEQTVWTRDDIFEMVKVPNDMENFYIGTDGNDTYDGLGGNDIIFGGSGNDTLKGGNGDDILYGEDGNDVLDGGSGNDMLYGGLGSDVYKFGRGSGKDTIIETDKNENDVDEILLGEGLTANDILISRDNSHLYVSIYGTTDDPTIYDVLTLKNYYSAGNMPFRLRFADGTVWNDLNEHVTVNTGQNEGDTIFGSGLADVITGTDRNDTIDGDNGNDTLNGGSGNDILIGGAGDDVLDGGSGNDILRGGSGADTYKFGFGRNDDVIEEDSFNGDVILLDAGITSDDVTFGRTSGALYIELSDHSRLTLKNFVNNSSNYGIILKYADGTTVNLRQKLLELPIKGTLFDDNLKGDASNITLIGRTGNDILDGGDGNDLLDGGEGDDVLKGGAGNDVYRFGFGYGKDEISDSLGTNVVELNEDVSAEDVAFKREMNDLFLMLNDGSSLKIVGGANPEDVATHISEIRFLNGADEALSVSTVLQSLPIHGTEGKNIINGSASNDTIYGYGGFDTLKGYAGADTLYGGDGDDTLDGGDGDDLLVGGAGNDILLGGAGNDTYRLELNGGHDEITDDYGLNVIEIDENVSAEDIVIERSTTSVKISLPDGSSLLLTKSASENEEAYHLETIKFLNGTDPDIDFMERLALEPLHGTNGADNIIGTSNNDTLNGLGDDDVIRGYAGNDTIDGGSGDDEIEGGAGNDTITGGSGNDVIDGGDGDDFIEGGAGNDEIEGGYGDDVYLFGFGDGNDYISDGYGSNVIELKADVSREDVSFKRVDSDFIMELSDGSSVRVGWGGTGSYPAYHIDTIKFLNGTDADIDVEALLPTVPVYISESGTTSFNTDTFVGVNDGETVHGSDEHDTIRGMGGNDTIYGNDGDDEIKGGNGNDTIYAGKGNDVVDGGDGDDFIEGGAGNDEIEGGYGDDVYLFGFGDGNDYISDGYGSNVIELKADVSREDVSFKRVDSDFIMELSDGSSVRVGWGGTGSYPAYHMDTIKFLNGTDADIDVETILSSIPVEVVSEKTISIVGNDGDETFYASDKRANIAARAGDDVLYGGNDNDDLSGDEGNDVLYGGDGDDTLEGGSGNDILEGGSGDDTLKGEDGNDIYRFGFGGGDDWITDWSGTNIIELKEDVTAEYVSLKRVGDDMVLHLSDGSSLSITSGASLGNTQYFNTIKFLNGTDEDIIISDILSSLPEEPEPVIINGTVADETFVSTSLNERFIGKAGNDTYRFGFGCGQDVIVENNGEDVIELEANVAATDVTLKRLNEDLVISLSDGSSLTIKGGTDYFYDNKYVERIRFLNGEDDDIVLNSELFSSMTVYGDDKPNAISGFSSDETFFAGSGNDSINALDGNDTIYGEDGNDTLKGSNGNDTLYGGAGNDTLEGGNGNDILDGGAGDDILDGRSGSDIYRFGFGYGNDVIEKDYASSSSQANIIELNAPVTAADVTIERLNTDVILKLSDGSTLTITNGIGGDVWYCFERIRFLNGTDEDIVFADVLHEVPGKGDEENNSLYASSSGSNTLYGFGGNDSLRGEAGNDTLYGGEGLDTLRGNGGNDILYGEAGNDILYGGNGNDILDGGSGNDRLEGESGNDVYRFGFGYGNDVARDGYGTNIIELQPEVASSDIIIERIDQDIIVKLSDGSSITVLGGGGSNNNYYFDRIKFLNGQDNDIVFSEYLSSVPAMGNDDNNSLFGTSGNDTMYGLGGRDIVYGYDGNDTLYGGEGKDSLHGGNGNDILYGGEGNDTLKGESGDDILDGGEGNDLLQGGNGNDIYVFGEGGGEDIISDADGSYGDDKLYFTLEDYDRLWFSKENGNLKVSVLGTEDSITVNGWFSSPTINSMSRLETENHYTTMEEVNSLVEAMSSFSRPDTSISENPILANELLSTVHEVWHLKTS